MLQRRRGFQNVCNKKKQVTLESFYFLNRKGSRDQKLIYMFPISDESGSLFEENLKII